MEFARGLRNIALVAVAALPACEKGKESTAAQAALGKSAAPVASAIKNVMEQFNVLTIGEAGRGGDGPLLFEIEKGLLNQQIDPNRIRDGIAALQLEVKKLSDAVQELGKQAAQPAGKGN